MWWWLAWAARVMRQYLSVDGVTENHQLVTSGPYRYVRHPVYGSFTAIPAGLSLVFRSHVLLGVALLWLAAGWWWAAAEESLLASREGLGDDYRAYRERTGRFLPRWGGARRRRLRPAYGCSSRWTCDHVPSEPLEGGAAVAYDEDVANRVRESMAAADVMADERQMFGGLAFMVAGHMTVGILGDELMVRVGKETHADALAQPHTRPMDFTNRPMTGFVYVAPAGFASDGDLHGWIDRALTYAATLPPK